MPLNQSSLPREWLMSDERLGDDLWAAVDALPPGAGIVFRHHATPARDRFELALKLGRLCVERGLILAVAGDVELALKAGANFVHNPHSPAPLAVSRSAHSLEEARAAAASGAALIFLSPIFPTRSHLGRVSLPREEARRIVSESTVPVIALGGMNRARFEQVRDDGYWGWAGIDAWVGNRPCFKR